MCGGSNHRAKAIEQYTLYGDYIKTYLIRFRLELFEKVKLLAKTYNISINKMMIRLLEIGYLEFIKSEIGEKTI